MKKSLLTISFALILAVGIPLVLFFSERSKRLHSEAGESVAANAEAALSPVVRLLSGAADGMARSLEYMVQSEQVRKENSVLSGEIARLTAENQVLREAISKFKRLDVSAEMADIHRWKAIPADVVAWNNMSWSRSLVINRGGSADVAVGDPVMFLNGLIGVVFRVTPWTATVQLLNDPRLAVGVLVLPSNERGLVQGTGVDDHVDVLLDSPGAKLRSGQFVVTSGVEGSLYPRGLPIGIVSALKENPYGKAVAEVRPFVNFDRIQEVVVLKTGRPQNFLEGGKAPSLDAKNAGGKDAGDKNSNLKGSSSDKGAKKGEANEKASSGVKTPASGISPASPRAAPAVPGPEAANIQTPTSGTAAASTSAPAPAGPVAAGGKSASAGKTPAGNKAPAENKASAGNKNSDTGRTGGSKPHGSQ